MKNNSAKLSPPQSMDELGKDLLAYGKSEAATPKAIDTIITELEDMKAMLEKYKKKELVPMSQE